MSPNFFEQNGISPHSQLYCRTGENRPSYSIVYLSLNYRSLLFNDFKVNKRRNLIISKIVLTTDQN